MQHAELLPVDVRHIINVLIQPAVMQHAELLPVDVKYTIKYIPHALRVLILAKVVMKMVHVIPLLVKNTNRVKAVVI
jgi:hypothetical protein